MPAEINVIQADLNNPAHAGAVVELLNAYAQDPMGDGKPLAESVQRGLIPGLRNHPNSLALLAYEGQQAVGLAICFVGFSTFAARPLINIHDLGVKQGFRGRGVGRALLDAVERKARDLGCCKITLEVREDNLPAQGLYERVGFAHVKYCGSTAMFWAKPLADQSNS